MNALAGRDTGGSTGAAEAYCDGLWSTPDLTAVVRIFARNQDALQAMDSGLGSLAAPLRRLLHREGQRPRAAALRLDQELRERGAQVAGALERRRGGAPDEAALARLRRELEERRPAFRDELTRRAGAGALEVSGALERMDAYRWLERVTHHAWRVTHHLGQLEREVPARLQVEPEEPA